MPGKESAILIKTSASDTNQRRCIPCWPYNRVAGDADMRTMFSEFMLAIASDPAAGATTQTMPSSERATLVHTMLHASLAIGEAFIIGIDAFNRLGF